MSSEIIRPFAYPEVDSRSHGVIALAHSLALFLPPDACFIGSIATIAHAGSVYRPIRDIDIAIPRQSFENTFLGQIPLLQFNDHIFSTHLKTPAVKTVRVDFVVYDPPTFPVFQGELASDIGYIPISASGPIQPVSIELEGIPLPVAPKEILKRLKESDRREVAYLDLRMLG